MLRSNQPDIKSFQIREAHTGDVPILNRLFPRHPDTHNQRLLKQAKRDASYLIASVHDKPVGHVLLLWNGVQEAAVQEAVPNCPAIEDLYVDSAYRSRGIGTKMLDECIKRIKEKGLHQLGASCGVENIKAKQFYHDNGFIDSGTPEYYVEWPYIDKDTGEQKMEGEMCRFLVKHL
jgi:ribosomal protein S18 acetylase RimI-like enzyme